MQEGIGCCGEVQIQTKSAGRRRRHSQPVCHNFQPGRRHNHDYLQNDDRKTQKQNQKTTTEQLKNAGKSAARCEGDRRPVHECIAGRLASPCSFAKRSTLPLALPTGLFLSEPVK